MNDQTVSENEPNNEFDIMRQKEMMQLLYESMLRGKHSKQQKTKGAFGSSRKPRYKPQSRN